MIRSARARVAREPRFGELEDVVARDVGDRALDRLVVELALGQQQAELLDLLLRREQVAFAALGEERERFARRALLLPREPRRDPARQLVALERIHGDRDAGVGERARTTPTPAPRDRAAAA